jgi:uncharacterized protein YecE (DUF72 family)
VISIGISGWRYGGWRGGFYPSSLAQRRELEYASRMLPTIEINGSFYSLQHPQSYERWYRETPEGFLFSVKGPRYITHMLKLNEPDKALANFFASGVFNLREKLGPILWQLPPNLGFNALKLDAFFSKLPRDTAQALALARRRDARMTGRCRLAIDAVRPLRHALEVRHNSFLDPEFVALLRRHDVALVVADTAGRWLYREDVTANFVYLRLHGDEELYASGYSDAALARWAERIKCWSAGAEPVDANRIAETRPARLPQRDVYCYFDNDMKVRAPYDARRLMEFVGITPPAPPAVS